VSDNSRSTTRANVPVIVGATFGVLGGLLLLAVVACFLRRRREKKAAYIDGPLEDLSQRPQGPSNLTPFMGEMHSEKIRPLHATKFPTIPSPDSTRRQTAYVADGPGVDNTLRREVEQLRRVVETLGTQQAQQQPQVVYQQDNLPDEPPPVYPSYQRSDDSDTTTGEDEGLLQDSYMSMREDSELSVPGLFGGRYEISDRVAGHIWPLEAVDKDPPSG
jgi:hypothetical protein